jgi:hypothetical protein
MADKVLEAVISGRSSLGKTLDSIADSAEDTSESFFGVASAAEATSEAFDDTEESTESLSSSLSGLTDNVVEASGVIEGLDEIVEDTSEQFDEATSEVVQYGSALSNLSDDAMEVVASQHQVQSSIDETGDEALESAAEVSVLDAALTGLGGASPTTDVNVESDDGIGLPNLSDVTRTVDYEKSGDIDVSDKEFTVSSDTEGFASTLSKIGAVSTAISALDGRTAEVGVDSEGFSLPNIGDFTPRFRRPNATSPSLPDAGTFSPDIERPSLPNLPDIGSLSLGIRKDTDDLGEFEYPEATDRKSTIKVVTENVGSAISEVGTLIGMFNVLDDTTATPEVDVEEEESSFSGLDLGRNATNTLNPPSFDVIGDLSLPSIPSLSDKSIGITADTDGFDDATEKSSSLLDSLKSLGGLVVTPKIRVESDTDEVGRVRSALGSIPSPQIGLPSLRRGGGDGDDREFNLPSLPNIGGDGDGFNLPSLPDIGGDGGSILPDFSGVVSGAMSAASAIGKFGKSLGMVLGMSRRLAGLARLAGMLASIGSAASVASAGLGVIGGVAIMGTLAGSIVSLTGAVGGLATAFLGLGGAIASVIGVGLYKKGKQIAEQSKEIKSAWQGAQKWISSFADEAKAALQPIFSLPTGDFLGGPFVFG